MRRESTVNVAPRKNLLRADLRSPGTAGIALAAGNHGGNHDRSAEPLARMIAGLHDGAADLVPERQRERMPRGDTVVIEPEIRVADAASRDFNHDFVSSGADLAFFEDHRSAHRLDCPSSHAHRVFLSKIK